MAVICGLAFIRSLMAAVFSARDERCNRRWRPGSCDVGPAPTGQLGH